MKKLILFVFITMLMVGCSVSKDDLANEIKTMKQERNALKSELVALRETVLFTNASLNELLAKKDLEVKIASGYEPNYILVLEIKQTHFSLDVEKHLKDAMNKLTFEISVDKRLYDSQKIDTELLREFRNGSFWFGGASLGDWVITVIDKKIE